MFGLTGLLALLDTILGRSFLAYLRSKLLFPALATVTDTGVLTVQHRLHVGGHHSVHLTATSEGEVIAPFCRRRNLGTEAWGSPCNAHKFRRPGSPINPSIGPGPVPELLLACPSFPALAQLPLLELPSGWEGREQVGQGQEERPRKAKNSLTV